MPTANSAYSPWIRLAAPWHTLPRPRAPPRWAGLDGDERGVGAGEDGVERLVGQARERAGAAHAGARLLRVVVDVGELRGAHRAEPAERGAQRGERRQRAGVAEDRGLDGHQALALNVQHAVQ